MYLSIYHSWSDHKIVTFVQHNLARGVIVTGKDFPVGVSRCGLYTTMRALECCSGRLADNIIYNNNNKTLLLYRITFDIVNIIIIIITIL